MAQTSENLTPNYSFPVFKCCDGELTFIINLYEDTNSWEARCPNCGRVWYLELVDIDTQICLRNMVVDENQEVKLISEFPKVRNYESQTYQKRSDPTDQVRWLP